jgi:glycosyltransferase involved in cell wall biosynthesis
MASWLARACMTRGGGGIRVLVNALPLRFGGGVTYLQSQLAALSAVAPDLTFHTLVAPWAKGLDALPGEVETVRVRSVAARFAYEQTLLTQRRADLVYCPANFAPVRHPDPVVLTVQNANYYGTGLSLPDTRPSRPWWKVKANHLAMRRADVVVAISSSLADEIRRTLPRLRTLQVIPSGAPDWPSTCAPVDGLPDRYVVVIGSLGPHKRVPESVTGWARSVDRSPDTAPPLVVVGPLDEAQRAACAAAAGAHADRLVFTGQVSGREEMRTIYERAMAMISSSALEAFPLTPGEAGSVGCPLVLSDIPPHREVSGGRARFVRPGDVEELATVLVDDVYTGRLDRTPWTWPVSWEQNAAAFAEVFRSTARQGRPDGRAAASAQARWRRRIARAVSTTMRTSLRIEREPSQAASMRNFSGSTRVRYASSASAAEARMRSSWRYSTDDRLVMPGSAWSTNAWTGSSQST